MAKEPSPVGFRVTTEERALLNDVAEYQGMTVSEFLRICTLDVAKGIRDDVGAQALKSELEETRARRARRVAAMTGHLLGVVRCKSVDVLGDTV